MLSSIKIAASLVAAASPAPHHVAIGVTVAPDAGRLSADAIVLPGPVSAGDEFRYLLSQHFLVHDAEAGPAARVTVEPTEDPWPGIQRITVRFSEAQENPQLRVRYAGRPNAAGDLPINMITPDLVELSLDGMWLPVRDDLQGSFTVSAQIAVMQEGAVLVAQGKVLEADRIFHVCREFPQIDFAFVASPLFHRVGDERFEFYGRDPDGEEGRLFRGQANAVIEFFEGWLGPMPGAPVRIILVARDRQSGYARLGYVVFVESTDAPSERGTGHFVAHEFAHAWFSGGLDEHRWLSESTAEYAAMRYSEAAFGPDRLEELKASKRKTAEGAIPLTDPNRTDRELYAKGPLLLFELEALMGREHFDPFFARIAREKVGTTDEFLRILKEVAGFDVVERFATMLGS